MSPEPARPTRPESKLSAWSRASTSSAASRRRYSSAPGSTDPERVDIGTPSSGVKPMRRVNGAAVEHRRHGAATAEVADDQAAHRDLLGRPLHGEPVEAVAPDPPPVPPRLRDRVGGHLRWDRRVERGVEDGDVRYVRMRRHRALDATQRGLVVERRDVFELVNRAADFVVDDDRLREAWAAVDDPVRDRVEVGSCSLLERIDLLRRLVFGDSESFKLVEPALTTRIAPTQYGQVQPLTSGWSSPCSLVHARASKRSSLISSRRCAARPAQTGHAIDHVHDEVVAIEVVEHDHVERRRRRPLFLVAAHVEVVVVRSPVRQPVHQPRIAVIGEDDRSVRREERVEVAVREPVRMLALRLEPHQVDDVDDPHAQLPADARGEAPWPRASRGSARRRSKRGRHRALRPHRSTPTPRCRRRACSARSLPPWRGSRGSVCFPATITFT